MLNEAKTPCRSVLKTIRGLICTAWALLFLPNIAGAADTQLISVTPGKNTDVYFEINVSGKVYLAINAPAAGEPCANFWWIQWPFGNIKDLGRHCGIVAFDIPGFFDLAFSAKLRVGGAKQPLKIVAAANQQVAQTLKVTFP